MWRKKNLNGLVWNFKGASAKFKEKRREEKKKKEMVVVTKQEVCLVHAPHHHIKDAEIFQTSSCNVEFSCQIFVNALS